MFAVSGGLATSTSSSSSSSSSTNSSNSSTLVETVRLNLDDFSESFLTCATCLYQFDGDRRRPKLLSCSHTVCRYCLEQIVELPQNRETGTFRCPICRETILVPRGGVTSLPPSFIVNQLLDLMSRQRR
jgi:tripartite motif-containing protein 2/3